MSEVIATIGSAALACAGLGVAAYCRWHGNISAASAALAFTAFNLFVAAYPLSECRP